MEEDILHLLPHPSIAHRCSLKSLKVERNSRKIKKCSPFPMTAIHAAQNFLSLSSLKRGGDLLPKSSAIVSARYLFFFFLELCLRANRPPQKKPCCCFDRASFCIPSRRTRKRNFCSCGSSCHSNSKLPEWPPNNRLREKKYEIDKV